MWEQDGDGKAPPAAGAVGEAPRPAEEAVAQAASFATLRDYLAWLEARGELVHVATPVQAEYEIAAILRRLEQERGPAVLFENVVGREFRAVGGVYGTLERLAWGIGASVREYGAVAAALSRRRLPATIVGGATPPCQEVIRRGGDVDSLRFPILHHHEKDAGPYITGGVSITRDPDLDKLHASINRIQVVSGSYCRIHLAPGYDHWNIQRRAEQRGRPLEIAIAIGVPPALAYAAAANLAPNDSELALAGGYLGAPLELAPCVAIDGVAPIHAEIVLEAVIPPAVRELEGPFADCTDHYTQNEQSHVFEIRAITHRRDAIYQAVTAGAPYSECDHIQWSGRQYRVWEYVRNYARDLRGISMTVGGMGTMHVVVSIRPTHPGEPRGIISALLAIPNIKGVTVVDDDVDVFDPNDVEWAVATRFQPDRDLMVLQDMLGIPIDPSIYKGHLLTAKWGMDATHKKGAAGDERVRPHPDSVELVNRRWAQYFP